MIIPGFTFLSRRPPYQTKHLYIIISPIIAGKVIFVNVTTMKVDNDDTCILQKGDHSFIRYESIINYGDAIEAEVHLLEEAISKNYIEPDDPISGDLLKKIQAGALISPAFKRAFLKYIPSP